MPLDAKGVTRQAFHMAQHLVDGIDHRGQPGVADQRGITRHVTGKDADFRSGAKDAAQLCAFLGDGDKEPPCAFVGQCRGDLRKAKAIGIRLDHGAGLGLRHFGK